MSNNMSGAPCYTCAHGSMCTYRDQYLKFYEHRDQVMCKVGDGKSTDNVVDTSSEVQVSVEHRYLNGPGLEDLYRRLGMSAPTYCCLVPQNRCPLARPGVGSYDRDYFDSPIMNKWNAPLGYISSICEPDKWEASKYTLPYKKPFIPMNDPCRKCQVATGEKPKSSLMIAGTPYSTFNVTRIPCRTGEILSRDAIAPPENIAPYYVVDEDSTPESFEIKGEDTKVIVYYRFVYKDKIPPTPGIWIEDSAMEERGMMHNVAILYGNRSAYTYRPFKKDPDFTTIPHAEQIKCRIISVRSAHRRLTTRYVEGEEMLMKKILVENTEPIHAKGTKHVRYVADVKRDRGSHPFIPVDAEYVEMRVAEGDIIDFEISVPNTHNLFFKMMEYMNCCPELVETHFSRGRVDYHLRYTVEDHDKILHMCLINLEDKEAFANDRIDYPDLNQNGVTITPFRMTISVDNGHEFHPLTTLAPRAWNNVDEDHVSWGDNLPYSWSIYRRSFKLAGFVDAVADAIDFREDMEINTSSVYEDRIFHDVWFCSIGNVNSREPGYSAFAKWEIDFSAFFMAHQHMMDTIHCNDDRLRDDGAIIRLADEDGVQSMRSEMVQFVPKLGTGVFQSNLLPALSIRSNSLTELKNACEDIASALGSAWLDMSVFRVKLALLPKGTERFMYQNGAMPLTWEAQTFYPEEKPGPEEPGDDIENPGETDDPKDDGFMIPDEAAEMARDGVDITVYAENVPEDEEVEIPEETDPEVPEVPEAPEVPDETEPETVPTTPLTPAEPSGDSVPMVPLTPATPSGDSVPSIPLVPSTPSGDSVPSIPLTPATPSGNEVPAIPVKPATPTMNIEYIDGQSLGFTETLNKLEPCESEVAVMFIEPKPEQAFFMNPHQFSYMVQPIYFLLERAPIEVNQVFDCEPMKADENPSIHLLDTQFRGLDPIHQNMLDDSETPEELLRIDFDEEDMWKVSLAGELSKYYYLQNYVTSRAADITVNYRSGSDILKTEKWRVPIDQMVKIKTDISGIGLYYHYVNVTLGHDPDSEVGVMGRDPLDGSITFMSTIESDAHEIAVAIHTMWSAEHPDEFTLFFDAKHDTEIDVYLMRDQVDKNAYCARCAGYVDTSADEFKTWLKWVPDCLKYTPLH